MTFAEIQKQGLIHLYKRDKITENLYDACGFRTDYRFITKSHEEHSEKKQR